MTASGRDDHARVLAGIEAAARFHGQDAQRRLVELALESLLRALGLRDEEILLQRRFHVRHLVDGLEPAAMSFSAEVFAEKGAVQQA